MKANTQSIRNRVLSGDKTRTPLTDKQFRKIMRPLWRQRKALERAGLCNPPRNHACCIECNNCPFAKRDSIASFDVLAERSRMALMSRR